MVMLTVVFDVRDILCHAILHGQTVNT